ncbi:unnamed protein product, partial [Didymodactylos carnosus]
CNLIRIKWVPSKNTLIPTSERSTSITALSTTTPFPQTMFNGACGDYQQQQQTVREKPCRFLSQIHHQHSKGFLISSKNTDDSSNNTTSHYQSNFILPTIINKLMNVKNTNAPIQLTSSSELSPLALCQQKRQPSETEHTIVDVSDEDYEYKLN